MGKTVEDMQRAVDLYQSELAKLQQRAISAASASASPSAAPVPIPVSAPSASTPLPPSSGSGQGSNASVASGHTSPSGSQVWKSPKVHYSHSRVGNILFTHLSLCSALPPWRPWPPSARADLRTTTTRTRTARAAVASLRWPTSNLEPPAVWVPSASLPPPSSPLLPHLDLEGH